MSSVNSVLYQGNMSAENYTTLLIFKYLRCFEMEIDKNPFRRHFNMMKTPRLLTRLRKTAKNSNKIAIVHAGTRITEK